MADELRQDKGRFRSAKMTDEGFLFVDGLATRAGVFPYNRADGGVRWELRPEEEVFDEASMASLGKKPITDNHPPEMVTSENAEDFQVGTTGDEVARHTDDTGLPFVRVSGAIHQKKAIDTARNRRKENSAGYSVDLLDEQGVWDAPDGRRIKYDAIQTNIRYNHLALVGRGRAGSKARWTLDSADISADRMTMDVMTNVRSAMHFSWMPQTSLDYDAADSSATERINQWARTEAGRYREGEPTQFDVDHEKRRAYLWSEMGDIDEPAEFAFRVTDIVDGELALVPQQVIRLTDALEAQEVTGLEDSELADLRDTVTELLGDIRAEHEEFTYLPKWERGNNTTRSDGQSLSTLLRAAIEGRRSRRYPRQRIVTDIARLAGMTSSGVESIINGTTTCPPMERLDAFASTLQVDRNLLINAALLDGCRYDSYDAGQNMPRGNKPEIVTSHRADGGELTTVRIDNAEFEVSPQLAQRLDSLSQRLDETEEENEELEKKNEELEEENDELKEDKSSLEAKADSLEEKLDGMPAPEEIEQARLDYANERMDLMAAAVRFDIDVERKDGEEPESNADLRRRIVNDSMERDVTDKDDAYIKTAFEILTERKDGDDDYRTDVAKLFGGKGKGKRTDDSDNPKVPESDERGDVFDLQNDYNARMKSGEAAGE